MGIPLGYSHTNERIVSSWFWLAQLARPYRLRLTLACGLALATCLLGMGAPILTQRVLTTPSESNQFTVVATPLVVLALFVGFQALASSLNTLLMGGVALNVVR